MTAIFLVSLLAVATGLAVVTALAKRPRTILLGWFSSGLVLSFYFLVLGFELLAILNAFFVVASTTVLHLFSSLYGTKNIAEVERRLTRGDWIHAGGACLAVAAILGFAFSEVRETSGPAPELPAAQFVSVLLREFPELSACLGFILFISLVGAATIGRPAWIRFSGGKMMGERK